MVHVLLGKMTAVYKALEIYSPALYTFELLHDHCGHWRRRHARRH